MTGLIINILQQLTRNLGLTGVVWDGAIFAKLD